MSELKYKNFVAIMTTQRSGSNFLGGCLNSHPNIVHIGPIFGSSRGWGYKGRCCKSVGSYEALVSCLGLVQKEYLSRPGIKIISLDIKYNRITPAMVRFLRKIKVIHLIRKDEKRLTLSHLVWSKYRKVSIPKRADWNVMYNESAKKKLLALEFHPQGDFIISKKQFKKDMMRIRKWRKQFTPLEDLRLYYENLTKNKEVQRLSRTISKKICRLLDLEYHPLTASTQKIVRGNMRRRLVIQ